MVELTSFISATRGTYFSTALVGSAMARTDDIPGNVGYFAFGNA